MTTFRSGSAGDVGQVREVNQDNLLVAPGLYVVADGMGGHRGGEVASQIAVDTMREHFEEPSSECLVAAAHAANTAVVTQAQENSELRGMGTTLSAVALVERDGADALGIVNVGDSRVYLLRAESQDLEQITDDHSLVETLVRQGQLTSDEAAVHPQRNILTRALGIGLDVLVDSWELLPVAGDRYLICSDGLFNEINESKIAAVLRRLDDPNEAAAELVRLANESGGRDNISVVITDVIEADTTVEGPGTTRILGAVHGEQREGAEHIAEPIPARPDGSGATAPTVAGAGAAAKRTAGATNDDAEPGDGGDAEPSEPDAPRSRFTWRVALFVLVFLGIVGATLGFLTWTANNTYFVGVADTGDEVVIFRGQPGGLLWIQPVPFEPTGITLDDLAATDRRAVEADKEEPSLEDARAYVDRLRAQLETDEADAGADDPEADDPDESDADPAGGGIGGAVDPTTEPGDDPAPVAATAAPTTVLP